MGREIKFRGLRSDGNGWVYGYYYKLTESQHYIMKDIHMWDVIPETVGQFTGLTDRNGKEIYEGDNVLYKTIVKSDENGKSILYKGEIQFWTGQTGCGWRYKSNRYTLMIKRSHSYQMEVIGNIHEK